MTKIGLQATRATMRQRILSFIEGNQESIVKTCSELIQINTSNPPGDCSEVIRYLKPKYKAIGVKFETISADKEYLNKLGHKYPRNNFLAMINGPKGHSNRKLCLAIGTHMDVIPAGDKQEWKYPPFSGTVADSKIWGRGAVDAKCSLVAQLFTMKALQDCNISLSRPLACIGTIDDEAPNNAISAGMQYVVREGLAKLGLGLPEFAINAEASGLNHVWGRFSGELTVKISFKGRSGHPPLGMNALHTAIKFWNILNTKRNKNLFPRPPRLIWLSGGSEIDLGITPEKAEMIFRISILDPNILPKVALNEIKRIIKEELSNKESNDESFKVDNISIISQEKAYNIDRRSKLVRTLEQSAIEVGLKSSYGGGVVGPGDLQFFLQRGVQGVTYGAGSLERCHVPNEFVSINELVTQTKIYALTAYSLCTI
jgi:succinyl-diaminopimelate desuccinylase